MKFRDFLANHLQYYIPPPNDFTAEFGLAILQKEKKAFKLGKVNFVEKIPQEDEFKLERIKEMIKDDDEVHNYLPDFSDTHRPDKGYLLNIINTVHKNSIVNWVKKVKKAKDEKKQLEKKDYILIDKELLRKLETFESIYDTDKDSKNRLAGLMCESRKKDKKERKKKFILEVTEKNFASYKESDA